MQFKTQIWEGSCLKIKLLFSPSEWRTSQDVPALYKSNWDTRKFSVHLLFSLNWALFSSKHVSKAVFSSPPMLFCFSASQFFPLQAWPFNLFISFPPRGKPKSVLQPRNEAEINQLHRLTRAWRRRPTMRPFGKTEHEFCLLLRSETIQFLYNTGKLKSL